MDSIKEEGKVSEDIKALTPVAPEVAHQAVVMPAVSAQEAKAAWKAYQDLKTAILEPEDIQEINGNKFLKKSYWRKAATFFNLSVDAIEERQETLPNGEIVFHFVCKATAPNGRYAIGAGSCSDRERNRENSIHNTRTTAETRAWNRSVSNLIGGGEVSAEEVNTSYEAKTAIGKLTGKPIKGDPSAFKIHKDIIDALIIKDEPRFQEVGEKIQADLKLSDKQQFLLRKMLADKFNSL